MGCDHCSHAGDDFLSHAVDHIIESNATKSGVTVNDSMQFLLETISAKVSAAGGLDDSVKFVVEGHTPILIDRSGVRQEDGAAAATLTAKMETFVGIFSGKINPALAFMSGKIKVDGDVRVASKLKSIF